MAPSADQWRVLLDLIEADHELVHGQFTAPGGVVRVTRKWEEIAIKVNGVPGGTAVKTAEQWRTSWVALRGRARQAGRDKARYLKGTGGGPRPEAVGLGLSALHERVLDMKGTAAAFGTDCPNPLQLDLRRASHGIPANPPLLSADAAELESGLESNGFSFPPLAPLPPPMANADSFAAPSAPPPCSSMQDFEFAAFAAPLPHPMANQIFNANAFLNWDVVNLDSGLRLVKNNLLVGGESAAETQNEDKVVELPASPKPKDGMPMHILHTPPRNSGLTPMSKRRSCQLESVTEYKHDHEESSPQVVERSESPAISLCSPLGVAHASATEPQEPRPHLEPKAHSHAVIVDLSDSPIVDTLQGVGHVSTKEVGRSCRRRLLVKSEPQELVVDPSNVMTKEMQTMDMSLLYGIVEGNNQVFRKMVQLLRSLQLQMN